MVYTHRFIREALSTITATATRASNNQISLIRSLISEKISFGRAASFLEYFFALHRTLTRRCLKDINTCLSKLWCGPQEINSKEIHLHLPFFVRCNRPAKKSEKTNRRIHFNIIVTFMLPSSQSLLKRPMLMNEFPLVLPQTRMIAGGKVSWLVGRIVYSTKRCEFKRNRIKSTHVRFRIENNQRLDQIETFLFRIHASACKWKTQSGTKSFRIFPLFCTFLSRHCTTTTWKCLISWRTWTQENNFLFFPWTSIQSFRIQLH